MSEDHGALDALADEMFAEVMKNGQSARRVETDAEAATVREVLRRLGQAAGVKLRTARMDDVVVAARLDSAIWGDDTATMRAKLTPPV